MGFMKRSGLKEALTQIYAENTIEKILSGHYYARALRGHLLVSLVISQLLLDSVQLSKEET